VARARMAISSSVRTVAVITPGFVTDGLETLEEIAIRARATFLAAGGSELLRVGAVEDHHDFLDALASLALA
ncbi:MAG TPA: ferrochelatase, partial [Gemmatimonadaceae bacterium]